MKNETVLDASAFLCVQRHEPREVGVRRLHKGQLFVTPAIFLPEVANALNKVERRGEMTGTKAKAVLKRAHLLVARTVTQDTETALALAIEHRLELYDACYLQIALQFNLSLSTLDRRMSTAASVLGIPLLLENLL